MHNGGPGRGEVMRNGPGFISTFSCHCHLYPARPQRPSVPFIYSFIQVISHSHSYCYLLTAFNRIHALLLSLEIIHKGIGLVEYQDVLSVGGMLVKQKYISSIKCVGEHEVCPLLHFVYI